MKMKQYYAVQRFFGDEDCEMLFGPASYEEAENFLVMKRVDDEPECYFIVSRFVDVIID